MNSIISYLVRVTCLFSIITTFSISIVMAESTQLQTYTDPVTEMQFILIPGGSFTMGDASSKDSWPPHEVTVQPFYMGKYEVTFAQYEKFCLATNRPLADDNGWGKGLRPVVNVSWHDANAFAQWLSDQTGKAFRLPSESEWEYAARAGTTTDFYWGDEIGRGNANCRDCGTSGDGQKTTEVGSFSPNPLGLFDIAGNVYEWTEDFKHPNYTIAPTDGSAWTDSPDYQYANLRVTRGGSWRQPHAELKSFVRCWDRTTDRIDEVGFRLVMVP